jgi:hypothetical protein
MFGKPEWFKKQSWGLVPVGREGWIYTGVAAGGVALPFSMLLFSRGWPEAIVWLAAGTAAVIWDVKQVVSAIDYPNGKPKPEKDVLYIGDDEVESLQTRQLDLKLRR